MANHSKEITSEEMKEFFNKLLPKELIGYVLFAAFFNIFIAFVAIYLGLMRFTIYSSGLRAFIIISLCAWAIPYVFLMSKKKREKNINFEFATKEQLKDFYKPQSKSELVLLCSFCALIAMIVLIISLNIASMPIFNANNYRNLISVQTSNSFVQDIEDFNEMKVPIVDKAYARQLGDKHLGEEVGLGSQFKVDNYTLIEHNGELYWIGALEHNGFFTWLANKDGTPGYIRVNATNPSDIALIRTHRLKYVPSAFLEQDLFRKLYFSSMGRSVDSRVSFELDDDGVPHYVFSVIEKKIAITKASNTRGILTLNATDGTVKYHNTDSIPVWVNHVYPTEEVNQQLNWWGHYVNGYFNSIFAKKEVMQISEGYNYIYNRGTFYLYTGMTSTGADESIIGVCLVDLRTKDNIRLYLTGGLTEYAAQQAAQGVFQAHNYYSTFPLLVNYHNEPTYLVLLKDNAGFVKQYAFVNLRDLSKYGTGDTLDKAELDYQRNIALTTGNRLENAVVQEVHSAVKNNNTVYFIIVRDSSGNLILDKDSKPKIFEASINISSRLPFLKAGDTISFDYTNEYIQRIEFIS